MLSTEELKKYILKQINDRISDNSCDHLFFSDVNRNMNEGVYIFAGPQLYHIKFVEKGKVKSEITTNDEREVLWHALHEITAHTVIIYASKNREIDKDFRRALFKKEIEIFCLFGKDFEIRKRNEIEEILRNHPYAD